jgi:hypothetical protein
MSSHATRPSSHPWLTGVAIYLASVGFAVAVALSAGCVVDVPSELSLDEVIVEQGNGAPSGAHYSLNVIGVPKGKTADMTGSSGHRIFVPRSGSAKILLSEGDFAVLDANGTDGSAAFQLPNPDPENDGITAYSVFARALGKPGGSSTTTTCATDPSDGEIVCSLESMVLVREGGKSSFTNVSRYLLYVYADLDGDGDAERYPLFDSSLEEYFWEYDNAGLHLAQLRFYQLATDVN